MKELDYKYNLKKTIKNSKKKVNLKLFFKWQLIITAIIGCLGLIASGPSGLISLALFYSLLTIRNVVISTSISFGEANGAIDELVTSINNDLQNNELVKENIKNSIIDTTRIENIKTNENGKVVSKEKKVIDNFYFLDTEDKIRVLRQIRSTLKEGKLNQKNDSLVLLEEEDIKNERLQIPVQKTKELKRK